MRLRLSPNRRGTMQGLIGVASLARCTLRSPTCECSDEAEGYPHFISILTISIIVLVYFWVPHHTRNLASCPCQYAGLLDSFFKHLVIASSSALRPGVFTAFRCDIAGLRLRLDSCALDYVYSVDYALSRG